MKDRPLPAEIGEYLILRPLGKGGMGEVHLARDRALDRLVAIKLIGNVAETPDARARFAIEARAVARLKHPNIVTVYRIGELDGRPYLVSEYVEGTALDRLERPLPRARALEIGRGLVRGLAAAHRQGVLHRDVKPANAIVADDGTVKLLDFGLAKLEDPGVAPTEPAPLTSSRVGTDPGSVTPSRLSTDPAWALEETAPSSGEWSTIAAGGTPKPDTSPTGELTVAGSQLGTPRYMSPEAWLGQRLRPASDVYSMGIVLWELLAGRHPFDKLDRHALEQRVCRDDVPPIAGAARGLSRALAEVVDRCGRRAPDQRFRDAVELQEALEAALAARPARPGRWIAAGIGALAIGGGIAALALRGGGPARGPAPDAGARVALDAGPPAPRPLTALGGCASDPAFADASTVVFSQQKGDAVDIMAVAVAGAGDATTIASSPGWDWRPAAGRHRGEVLYTRDGDDNRQQLVALDRASGVATAFPAVSAYAVAALDGEIYVLSSDILGAVGRLDGRALASVVEMPEGRGPDQLAGAGRRLAVVTAEEFGPSGLCVVELSDRSVRCLPVQRMLNARPAMTPDGVVLYYAAADGVRRLDVDHGRDDLVLPGVRAPGGLALSPDQRRLVYSDCESFGAIVAVGRGEPEVLVADGHAKDPGAGPGGLLAWAAPDERGGTRLWVRDGAGPPRELARTDGELGRAAFSPDGARIAYSVVGADSGIRSVDLAGGAPVAWTTDPHDRNPVWAAGGLAFSRLGAGGVPVAMFVPVPGAPARALADGWAVEGGDGTGDAVLVNRDSQEVGLLAIATGTITPVPLGEAGRFSILHVASSLDGKSLAVAGGADGSTLYHVDRATGVATVVHHLPVGQTAGAPALLADGRIAFRPTLWLGELYEVDGAWGR